MNAEQVALAVQLFAVVLPVPDEKCPICSRPIERRESVAFQMCSTCESNLRAEYVSVRLPRDGLTFHYQ